MRFDFIKKTAFGLLIGFFIGWNAGGQGNTLDALWPKERDGLRRMNEAMKKDKSQRLGVVFITSKGIYTTQSISQEEWRIVAGFQKIEKGQK